MPDANVWINFGRSAAIEGRLRALTDRGHTFAVAPPALMELFTGLGQDQERFSNDQRIFRWIDGKQFEILELPKPFMANILRTALPSPSGVKPNHYRELLQMVVASADHADFVSKANAPNSVWKLVENMNQIHNQVLDEELSALRRIAKKTALAEKMCTWFGAPGCRPNHVVFQRKFSAGLEFLESSLSKVHQGAKPERNDRGLYVDFQLLLYLADPNIHFLTGEGFAAEIRKSAQKDRIVKLGSLP